MRAALIVWIFGLQVAQAQDFATSAASTLTFHLVHKLHHVEGVSHSVEGRARLLPDGTAQVMVRVPSGSFDSGNVNRDAHAKEAIEAARYPFVVLKASGALVPPTQMPTTEQRSFTAQLSFHGVDESLTLPVTLRWENPGRVRATARFAISLEHFKVERPSLMFVKVDDQVWIDADLVFQK
jgi:polyisoprenoid-binding protein YceI